MSKLIFKDNFNNLDRWQTRHTPFPDLPEGPSNPRLRHDGRLELRLGRTTSGVVTTSHIATSPRTFRFGHFEARMRFKGPKGAHSAFWLQDLTDVYGIGGSEVDIVEHFGDNKIWQNVYYRTADSAPWPELERARRSVTKKDHGIDPYEWHVYGLVWRPDSYEFYVDGDLTNVITEGVSSTPKVMILSLLSSDYEWKNLDVENLKSYKTLVDWVKVSEDE